MLKRFSAFVVMALPVSAFADMPVVNTDLLQKNETLLSIAAVKYQRESSLDTRYGSAKYHGSAEAEGQQIFFVLGRGITDQLNVTVAASYMEYEAEQTSTGPVTIVQTQKASGVADPSLGIDYQLLAADFPLVASISVDTPTSSDSPGQSGAVVDGVTTSALEEGDAGAGKTRVRLGLAGSMPSGSNALEWGLASYLDDDADSENTYEAQLGWLHHFNERTTIRVGGVVYQQSGRVENNLSMGDLLQVGARIMLVHQPRPDLKLSLAYNYAVEDDLTFRSTDGMFRQDITDTTYQSVALGLAYLID